MPGALRLSIFICTLSSLFVAMAFAQNNETAANRAANSAPPATASVTTKPPAAKADPVEETIHGVKIVDAYRWLEDADSLPTQQFVRDQLAYTRSVLDRLPARDQLRARLTELLEIGYIGTPQVGGNFYFHTERTGTQNQPVLYVRENVKGKDRVLVDVNTLAADGTIALDWWTPTHDGRYVAYGTSASGSEMSTLHVVETATGKQLPDLIDRTRAASIAWLPDNTGFFYTRYPKKGEVAAGQEMYNRHVFFHHLGADPAQDPLIFGAGRDPQDWPNVDLSEDGRWLTITVGQGWAKSELYLQKAKSPAVRVSSGKEFLYQGTVYNGELYVLTNEDAPRFRVFKVAATHPERANWKEIIPQSKDARGAVIKDMRIIGGRLIVGFEHNAYSRLRAFTLDGVFIADVPLPGIGTVTGIGGEYDSKEMFYGFESFTFSGRIVAVPLSQLPPPGARGRSYTTLVPVEPGENANEVRQSIQAAAAKAPVDLHPYTWAEVKAPINPNVYETKQVFYPSKDGTKVPMFLVYRKGLLRNGANPTLLTGYGGFNVSSTPSFRRGSFVWLDRGGVYALANLRGGAEYGEDWHRAGMLDKKQNVFDDFIAAAEYLIAEKYTSRERLAISGGSNGGLLVGAVETQRPDLFKAVVCQVPLLDMLRYQNFQIAKLWIPEYGSADNAEQFKWLYAYSPYHHVKNGVSYPATLLMTADSDSRVDPMHAKKMAARLQAANAGPNPILLRIEPKAGHGAGKPVSKLIDESTDIYSFLFWQLGVK